ncbi:MAG TPA: pilus assembly protein PilM, partial [Candidatus Mcinerneyibacteriales bacterium]|nr:pilus assembly protein PilM [Candidatus Mcinerneyibacteriales bacterium]
MKKLIGLDIGSYSVKAVDIKVSSKDIEIKNFGHDLLSRESIVEGEIMDTNLIEEVIRTVFTRRKIKNKNLSISISGRNLILKSVQ